MKKLLLLFVLFLGCLVGSAQSPKYIFFFIGDGMGPVHVQLGGGDSLCFTQFPVRGELTTRSATDSITDSAAAGTALATGHKTKNGVIGMSADGRQKFESVAYVAQRAGKKVGIMTTVSIDHATPASFFASVASRKMADKIAEQIAPTGFDLFAGSGLVKPADAWGAIADSGYTVVRGREAKLEGKKVIWVQAAGKSLGELPYATERQADDMTLPEMTGQAIEFLAKDAPKGLFLMVEGGKIDWGSHANHAVNTRGEVIDFAAAVAQALAFYQKHPTETLIIVTADHETGGLSLNPTAWSSTDHTATKVPVYALGVGSELFAGWRDNTSITTTLKKMIE